MKNKVSCLENNNKEMKNTINKLEMDQENNIKEENIKENDMKLQISMYEKTINEFQ